MSLQLFPPKKGRPNWRVRGTHLGVRVDRSTKTGDRALARRLREQWKAEIEAGIYEKATSSLVAPVEETFASATLAYMKAGGDKRPLAKLLVHFGTKPLGEIDQKAIDEAASAIYPLGEDHEPKQLAATRNREVYTPISAVLKHAGRDFKIRRPKGSRGKVVLDWLWPEQAERLIHAADGLNNEFGLLLRFLLYTGCRLGDVVGHRKGNPLTCNDVRLNESFAFVGKTKNGEPRAVHLPPVLVAALANHPRGVDRREERLFRFHQGGALRYLLNSAKLVASGKRPPGRVKRGRTRAPPKHELEFVTFHVLCHTWATWMRRFGGLDTKGLVATGRWRDESSASRYQHVVVSEESRRADMLPAISPQSGVKLVRNESK